MNYIIIHYLCILIYRSGSLVGYTPRIQSKGSWFEPRDGYTLHLGYLKLRCDRAGSAYHAVNGTGLRILLDFKLKGQEMRSKFISK